MFYHKQRYWIFCFWVWNPLIWCLFWPRKQCTCFCMWKKSFWTFAMSMRRCASMHSKKQITEQILQLAGPSIVSKYLVRNLHVSAFHHTNIFVMIRSSVIEDVILHRQISTICWVCKFLYCRIYFLNNPCIMIYITKPWVYLKIMKLAE